MSPAHPPVSPGTDLTLKAPRGSSQSVQDPRGALLCLWYRA